MSLPFSLQSVLKVTIYKRDQLTTDLICCDVEVDSPNGIQMLSIHEEARDWDLWLAELGKLPGFDADWHTKVSQPAFEACITEVYRRKIG